MAAKKKLVKKAPAKKAAPKKVAAKKAAPKMAAKKSAKPAAKKAAAPKKAASAAKPSAAPRNEKAHHTSLANFLSPLDDRIVVEPDAPETKTAGGLIIPGFMTEGPARGTVLAKGPGHRNKKGKLRPLDVEVGDKVVYSEYAGTKLNFANAKVLILREEDILGIVE
jgi:chaperonin GroES